MPAFVEPFSHVDRTMGTVGRVAKVAQIVGVDCGVAAHGYGGLRFTRVRALCPDCLPFEMPWF